MTTQMTTDLNVQAPEFIPGVKASRILALSQRCVSTAWRRQKESEAQEKKRVAEEDAWKTERDWVRWANSQMQKGVKLLPSQRSRLAKYEKAASATDSESDRASACASVASTVRVLKCHFCAREGHKRAHCPQLKCRYCLKQGHQQKECSAFDDDREWVKWARKQIRNGGKLSGGEHRFLENWNAAAKRARESVR